MCHPVLIVARDMLGHVSRLSVTTVADRVTSVLPALCSWEVHVRQWHQCTRGLRTVLHFTRERNRDRWAMVQEAQFEEVSCQGQQGLDQQWVTQDKPESLPSINKRQRKLAMR